MPGAGELVRGGPGAHPPTQWDLPSCGRRSGRVVKARPWRLRAPPGRCHWAAGLERPGAPAAAGTCAAIRGLPWEPRLAASGVRGKFLGWGRGCLVRAGPMQRRAVRGDHGDGRLRTAAVPESAGDRAGGGSVGGHPPSRPLRPCVPAAACGPSPRQTHSPGTSR